MGPKNAPDYNESKSDIKPQLQRVDKKKTYVELDDPVVRARYLMSDFNVAEYKKHSRIRKALLILILSMIIVGAIAIIWLTIWHR